MRYKYLLHAWPSANDVDERQVGVKCSLFVCEVDGQWSSWSSWSACDPDCRRYRSRLCDSPSPQNDGRFCDGSDLSTDNCTQLLCTGLCLLSYLLVILSVY